MRLLPAGWPAAILLSFALQGCATYKAKPLIPADEFETLTQRGLEPLPAGEIENSAVPRDWFPLSAAVNFEDGLDLAEANALALFYAPRIRAARSEANVSAGQLLKAGLLKNPELFVGPRFTTNPTDLILPATLLFEIPLGGRLGAERDKAQSDVDAARQHVIAIELEVLVDVRRRFLRATALGAKRRILSTMAERSDAASRWVGRLERAGEVDALGASLIQIDRDEVHQDLRESEADYISARAALYELIGILPTAPVDVVASSSPALPPLPDANRKAALRHPRLQLRETQYRAAEHALRVEIARQYPELWIGPDYEFAEGVTGQPSFGIGVALTLPIFDRNKGGIAAADARRTAAREAYQAELLRLAREETSARAAYASAFELVSHFRTEMQPSLDRTERVISERLRGGQSSILELVASRRAVARARMRFIALRTRAAVAKLEAAYAGGWVLPRAPEGETTP